MKVYFLLIHILLFDSFVYVLLSVSFIFQSFMHVVLFFFVIYSVIVTCKFCDSTALYVQKVFVSFPFLIVPYHINLVTKLIDLLHSHACTISVTMDWRISYLAIALFCNFYCIFI